jgi:LmbE family N-acetylglucosaminyl deacetylase
MSRLSSKTVAIIVAHPDDETLWAGGTILSHPAWNCFIVCLCRGSDNDRAFRFNNALKILKSDGIIGDLDDGPEQNPLDERMVEHTILDLLPPRLFDLIITHNPTGEYTKHIRHEEVSKAVIKLWNNGKIIANELWTFAYEDGNKQYLPRPAENAAIYKPLTNRIQNRKYKIITETYGFEKNSWEAETTPKSEAFWEFNDPILAKDWIRQLENIKMKNYKDESIGVI